VSQALRIGVIGATGQGGYGHGLDSAFRQVPGTTIVAVADPNREAGQKKARELGAENSHTDFRRMLDNEQLDIVCIGPRWLTHRVEMVEAAAEAGCHIYCEKPFAADLVSADRMHSACRQAKVKLAMAHQWRAMPPIRRALQDIAAGRHGRLLRASTRPKDDHRGGGEELLVHGTHWFDLLITMAGQPRWASAHIQVGHRDATARDRTDATEPVGPITGDSISALWGFRDGVRGYFESTAHLSVRGKSNFDNLYGVFLECERAAIHFRQPGDAWVYPAPKVLPDHKHLSWKKIVIPGWHTDEDGKPRDVRRTWIAHGNTVLARDLFDAIREDREPLSGLQNAMSITEMVQGAYASHFAAGRRLPIPLTDRKHPLEG
tara:strand:- start:263 stop:1390 length:1128 start_codon:yes stop_codon:yes gene_type:complete